MFKTSVHLILVLYCQLYHLIHGGRLVRHEWLLLLGYLKWGCGEVWGRRVDPCSSNLVYHMTSHHAGPVTKVKGSVSGGQFMFVVS
ncbi:hypothetical protein E2C01_041241 [Portunus trituberculatus]|uniref:Secreted protein n=1 Tax=Portunus trituberculatus TaxID=210409 RepID=A0A5B7FM26_PORTR|nr:hypothetical protein [Portunus trituberculatus]